MALIQLIYSSMLAGNDESVIQPIHASALRHNKENSITGMLLFYQGYFLQVLEGERNDVMSTYLRICQDPRHSKVRTLLEQNTKDRQFPTWLMGFRNINKTYLNEFPEYKPYCEDGFAGEELRSKPGVALRMVQAFSRYETP
jgi:hypothetical protein